MTFRTPSAKPSTIGLLSRCSLVTFLLLFAAPAARAVTESDLATLALTTSTMAAKSTAPGDLSIGWLLGRMALALGIVFGLMWLVLWAAKRYLPQATGKSARGANMIEILATRAIGQRRSLMLVRAQGKTLLLGVTPQAISTLAELESEDELTSWQDAALEAGLPPEPPPPGRGPTFKI